MSDGWVYIIKNLGNTHLKIGTSTSPQGRLWTFQRCTCDTMVLLEKHLFSMDYGEPDVDYLVEGWVHAKLLPYRIRGEWFHAEALPFAHELIARCAARWANRKKPNWKVGHCRHCMLAMSNVKPPDADWTIWHSGFCSSDCFCSFWRPRHEKQSRMKQLVKAARREAEDLFYGEN